MGAWSQGGRVMGTTKAAFFANSLLGLVVKAMLWAPTSWKRFTASVGRLGAPEMDTAQTTLLWRVSGSQPL